MQLFILVTYILVLYGISWYASKLIRQGKGGAVQYLLAGRNLPTVVVAAMLAGLAIGGASTVGVAEHAYKVGLSAGWYNAAWGAAGIIVGLFVADYFRRMEVNTIPEMMERMYGKQARMISVLAQLLIMMVITSLQYVAGGAVLT
ncbi:MAG: sodium:solute symporter family protein, partial [Synergistales bacterium]|nr:sodium:solute symporter family protein [Synergistales bacterium]